MTSLKQTWIQSNWSEHLKQHPDKRFRTFIILSGQCSGKMDTKCFIYNFYVFDTNGGRVLMCALAKIGLTFNERNAHELKVGILPRLIRCKFCTLIKAMRGQVYWQRGVFWKVKAGKWCFGGLLPAVPNAEQWQVSGSYVRFLQPLDHKTEYILFLSCRPFSTYNV